MPERYLERWYIAVSFAPVGQEKSHKWLESLIKDMSIQFFAEDQDDSSE
jgi:hypothetical protein